MFEGQALENLLVKTQELAAFYGLKMLAAVAILVIGRLITSLLRRVLERALEKAHLEPTLQKFTVKLFTTALTIFIILAALGQLGIQTTSFIAVIGAAGLAIGLALQGSLANFAAGVLMLIFKPFKEGDFIEGGGTMGSVLEIGIFTTTLKSPDNKKIIIPNAKLTSDNIVNFTATGTRRLDLVAGVSYQDDLNKVEKVLKDILDNEPRVLKDPEYTVGVLELGDSSVNFAVRPWVKTEEYWGLYFDLQKRIKQTFDAEGISIPFPQRDVHIYNEKSE